MAYTIEDKLYTEDPMLDELVHNVKLMIQGIVMKDAEEANNNESLESIEESDIYVAIRSGNQRFSMFQYTEEILRMLGVFTQSEINNYVVDNDMIPEEYRDQLLEIAVGIFMNNYEEKNNYYRNLNGKPNYGTNGLYVDSSLIPSEYHQYFDFTKTIDQFTDNQIFILEKFNILNDLKEENPDLTYLNHLGSKAIDVFFARKAPPFGLLYINQSVENIVLVRFKEILETNRVIYLKRHYSTAYKFTSEYYEKFVIIMIIAQSVCDLLVEMPEWYIRRDVFDIRTCQFILESNGVKFFNQIPLKYQISLVRNLNQIIKNKSCNKNIYDICEIFGLKDVVVYKYFLLKHRKLDENGRYVKADQDQEVIEDLNGRYAKQEQFYIDIDGLNALADLEEEMKDYNGSDSGLDIATEEDLNDMYDLLFVRTPIEEIFDNFSRNNINNLKYDTVTTEDPYWDGENDHEYVRNQILEKDFTVEATKYLSVETITSAKEYVFQLEYFLNLLFNNKVDKSLLNLQVPIINSDMSFNLLDLFILLYTLTFKYYEPAMDDIIKNTNRYNPIHEPEPEIIFLGDYDPVELGDYNCDGRYAKNEADYYKAYGGTAYIDEEDDKVNDVNGGISLNISPVDVDPYYNPVELDDYNCNGRYAKNEIEYFVVNGGYAYRDLEGDTIPLYDINGAASYDNTKEVDSLDLEYARWISYNCGFADIDESIIVNTVIGGHAEKSKYKYDNLQGGHSLRSMVDLDYPEADEDIVNVETADLECEGLRAFEFTKYLDLNGCDSIWGDDEYYSDIYIMDGGHAVNSYINSYTDLDPDIYEDPCEFYKEWCDNSRKDFTYIDTYDRLFGFNLYADLNWLAEKLASNRHPKFKFLRGYTLEELGVDRFLVPTDEQFNNIEELLNIYHNNKEIYDKFTKEMLNADNQDDYYVYEFVYKYLFTMEWNQDYFIKSNGEMAIRYSEFLKDKDFVLYSFFEDIMSEPDYQTRQYLMNEKMDLIIESMELYIDSMDLNYIFNFVPIRSRSLILQYAFLLINFFKSYKVTMLENGNTILFDDDVTNKVQINDKIAYSNIGYIYYDSLGIREEMELDIEHELEELPSIEDRLYFYEDYQEMIELDGKSGGSSLIKAFDINGNIEKNDLLSIFNNTEFNGFVDFNGGDSSDLFVDEEEVLEEDELLNADGGDSSYDVRYELNSGSSAVVVFDYDINCGAAS